MYDFDVQVKTKPKGDFLIVTSNNDVIYFKVENEEPEQKDLDEIVDLIRDELTTSQDVC
ncbi:hypothetical protein [Haloplasma contractile]|uniref:Uncharacterized protein n=1 Tax=Haloplasma contractile SSD-17B TaxID=1033810 RepID=F7PRG6_9MOLU|nr:hypothetical protein [Haloplasma contractile]ERJ11708.1 hypothetical protein HLPCO_002191 [Haloplasma contractile SSD-17B]